MSASSWDECPKCKVEADRQHQERIEAVAKAYGKAPPDEYLRLVEEAKKPVEVEETLREDWELGTYHGTPEAAKFYVSYSCHCDKCGFSHRFKHESNVLLSAATPAADMRPNRSPAISSRSKDRMTPEDRASVISQLVPVPCFDRDRKVQTLLRQKVYRAVKAAILDAIAEERERCATVATVNLADEAADEIRTGVDYAAR